MKIIHVVGARPNFMKIAPVYDALARYADVQQIVVHTGQHYDANMSDIFFQQLGLPQPDINLEIGSGNHGLQTGQTMIKFEELVLKDRPDWVVVYGDVNSTVAAALVCAKLAIPIAHVEAGLRSFDRRMPEEINRVVTDQLSDVLFTPSLDGNANLQREGVAESRIHFVGNVMIDTLVRLLPRAQESWDGLQSRLGIDTFGLITLHRPSNVDNAQSLERIVTTLSAIARDLPLLFPVHPRTRSRLESSGILANTRDIVFVDPLGYIEFLALQEKASVILTDSGGVQAEASYLGTPCITIRENTEWTVTLTHGTNVLVGNDMKRLLEECKRALSQNAQRKTPPPLWDGRAGERIASVLLD